MNLERVSNALKCEQPDRALTVLQVREMSLADLCMLGKVDQSPSTLSSKSADVLSNSCN